MADIQQMAGRRSCPADVVEDDRVGIDAACRPVHEDDVDAKPALRFEIAVVAAGRDHDETVDVPFQQVGHDPLLADDVLGRAAEDHRRRVPVGDRFDGSRDGPVERVEQVGDDQPDARGRRARAQVLGDDVPPETQADRSALDAGTDRGANVRFVVEYP